MPAVSAVAVAARTGPGETGWAELKVAARVKVLRRARLGLAARAEELAEAISPELARNKADTLAAEVLPLLAACRFLEQEAAGILALRRLGRRGLPFWLRGVRSAVERVPLGTVLVIGPANYPLFLPGVQALQGLAAGNAVVWKPGRGGRRVAELVAEELRAAGLPDGMLRVTGESAEEGLAALRAGVDKVFFTGSGTAGRAVMKVAAELGTPVVAELSGCDAVAVLRGADLARVVKALGFGMRLNGSATCMAPRRVMLVGFGSAEARSFVERLRGELDAVRGIRLSEAARQQLWGLVDEAVEAGAVCCGLREDDAQKPVVLTGVRSEMELARADVFAPVLSVMEFEDVEAMLRAEKACPFGLTAAVFGVEREALDVGRRMKTGTLLVNDLIVATADPRVPFGGRRGSGFGVTRGAEGLLEMTAVRTVLVRRGKSLREYGATGAAHEELFGGVIAMSHGRGLKTRFAGLRRLVAAAKTMGEKR